MSTNIAPESVAAEPGDRVIFSGVNSNNDTNVLVASLEQESVPAFHLTNTAMVDGTAILTRLAAKADISHTHEMTEVTGLTSALMGKASVSHTHSADDVMDGTTNKAYTAIEKTKLSGVAPEATANDTDANLKARTNHTGAQAIGTVTGLQAALDAKQMAIASGAHIADAATNAATNSPTNLNPVTTLLGGLTGEVNATNAKQNDLAAKYNDLAAKYNTLLDRMEAQSLLLAS